MGNQVRMGDMLDDPLIGLTGQPFLEELVRRIRDRFDASFVWIGRFYTLGHERVKIVAGASAKGLPQIEDYEIHTTPCAMKHQNSPRNSHDAYCAQPLYDAYGNVIGLLGLCRRNSNEDEKSIARALGQFSERIGTELERIEGEEISHSISLSAPPNSVWSSENAKRLDRFCAHVGETFAARFAFFTEVVESDCDQFRLIASSINTAPSRLPNAITKAYFDALNGHRELNDSVLFKSGLQNAFPEGALPYGIVIDSYLGVFVKNDQGTVIGHFAVLHDTPLDPNLANSAELQRLSKDARLVLEKRQTEDRRRHLEREFQEKRKKERLGVIAGTIAHDLNNSLARILANALLASGDPLTSDHSKQCILNIEESVIKARALIYQSLNFLSHDFTSVQGLSDVAAVVEEAATLIPQGPGNGAGIKLLEIQTNLSIAMEPTKLAQLLIYLFLNGQEAIGADNGAVEVRVVRQLLTPRSRSKMLLCPQSLPDNVVLIEVSDNGAGIGKGELAQITDPFFRTKRQGRGLGLAAAQGIIKANGGGLAVTSRLGRGTHIRVCFPAVRSEALLPG